MLRQTRGFRSPYVSTILRSQLQGNILAWAFGLTSIILAYPQVTAMNLQRAVELELVVGVDGRVRDVRSSGQLIIPPEIMNAAVRGIEFAPGTVDGIATEMITLVSG